MWTWIALATLAAAAAMFAAHWLLQRRLQTRALRALRWIENSLGPNGHVSGMRWLSSTEFEVPIKVVHAIFQRPRVEVRLQPAFGAFRKAEPESFTFLSDLDCTPAFQMGFENLRWFARTDKKLPADAPGWQVSNCVPVVLTTRLDWSKDVTTAVYSVLQSERKELVNVTFRQTSPHFSATFPLDSISSEQAEPLEFLDVVREMAEAAALNKKAG